jgi:hypothetical protein
MAKKSSEDFVETFPVSTEPLFIPGYVRIVNLKPSERDVHLRDGDGPHLMPFRRDWQAHISEPILKKRLTPHLWAMKKRGEIDIVEVTK